MPLHKIIVIAGPTASGKSARALDVAREENGVIINADSLQIYAALPILTAQPSAVEQAAMPHRLYGILQPDDKCTARRWSDLALAEIRTALENKQTPIVVGGTGFYIKALMEGLSPIPEVPENIRRAAQEKMRALGNAAFHAYVTQIDPALAARIPPGDTQRLIRAAEVFEATGERLSEWQKIPPEKPPADLSFEILLVCPTREELYARCDARFLKMMEMGALEEVRAYNGPPSIALGYAELRAHLDGKITREEAIAQAQQKTRNYAKRQATWFKNQL